MLIVVGDASETLATLYPYYRLQEAALEPVVAGPEKRTFQMVMHEVRPGWTITKEWEGYQIAADVAFADVDPREYLGVKDRTVNGTSATVSRSVSCVRAWSGR